MTNPPAIASIGRALRLRALLACALAVVAALTATSPAAAKVPADFFGIDAEVADAGDYPAMAGAGFGTFRLAINWASVQPTEDGPYDFSSSDAGVSAAASAGLTPIVDVFGSPGYVGGVTDAGLIPPRSAADLNRWRDLMAALVARYGPGGDFFDEHPELQGHEVGTWIVWNEENAVAYWAPKASPRQYAKLLERADDGVRSVDPGAEVVVGGMYGYPRDPKAMTAERFLTKLYEVKGIKRHFDSISTHPYGPDVAAVKQQAKELVSVARRAGDRGVGLWVGELGWASDGPKRSPSVVGKKGQAKNMEDGLGLIVRKRKSWNVRGVLIYTWKDFAPGTLSCQWCPWAGLVNRKGNPKPAYEAVTKLIRKQT